MTKPRRVDVLVIVALLSTLVLGACAVLTGQRISWFHDRANDSLHILIYYDGIHEAKGHGKGSEQIAKFVKNDEILMLEWPGHFPTGDLRHRQGLGKEAEFSRALASAIEVKVLGHYRAPSGQMGAAQLVSINKVSQFIDNVNAFINWNLLRRPAARDAGSRSMTRIRAAAEKGHEWITLDGHAIRVSLPIDHWSWARTKGRGFQSLARQIIQELSRARKSNDLLTSRTLAQAISSVPCSYVERRNSVLFTLGRRDKPVTLRLRTGRPYNDQLEGTVIKHAAVDLDTRALKAELGSVDWLSGSQRAAVLAMSPPERRVRILLSRIARQGVNQKAEAIKELEAWGEAWNKEHEYPVAPPVGVEKFTQATQWRAFYERMLSFPLEPTPRR